MVDMVIDLFNWRKLEEVKVGTRGESNCKKSMSFGNLKNHSESQNSKLYRFIRIKMIPKN